MRQTSKGLSKFYVHAVIEGSAPKKVYPYPNGDNGVYLFDNGCFANPAQVVEIGDNVRLANGISPEISGRVVTVVRIRTLNQVEG